MIKKVLENIFRSINPIIIFQLLIMPISVTHAQDKKEEKSSFFSWDTVEEYLPMVMNGANAFFGNLFSTMNQNQGGSQYDAYKAQFDRDLALVPIAPQNVKGGAIFNGCFVLPAQINKLPGSMSCSQQPPQSIQGGYAAALIDTMEANLAQIETFEVKGNDEYAQQGVGCYESKIENFETLLKQRDAEINKYKQRLKEMLDNFNLLAKNDLKEIQKQTALINGGPNRDEHLLDFEFSSLFSGARDPGGICGSLISNLELDEAASSQSGGGLNGIEKVLNNKLTSASNGSSSPQQILTQAKNIRSEIVGLSQALSKNMTDNSLDQADLSAISYRGKFLNKNSDAIANVVESTNKKIEQSFNKIEKDLNVSSILQGNPSLQRELGNIKSGSLDLNELNTRLKKYERDSKKACLTKTINEKFGGITGFTSKLTKPGVSKKANRESDSLLKNVIADSFSSESDIDEYLKEVEKVQNTGLNSRYYITTGKSIQIGDRTITASAPMRPSQLIEIINDTCHQNFEAQNENNSSGYSQADAVKVLKNYATGRDRQRMVAASTIETELQNELLHCPNDTTTGSGALSCGGDTYNSNSNSFCLRTAEKCASNTKACLNKVTEEKNKIVNERKNYVNNYKAQVNKFKTDLRKELKAFNNFIEVNARSLDAQLGLGTIFGVPPIDFDDSKEARLGLEQGIDPNLALEDPEEYMERMLANIDLIQEQTTQQKDETLQKLNQKKNDFISNYSNNKSYINSIIKDCNGAISQTSESLNKQNEAISKNNADITKACQKLDAFNRNPDGVEHEELADELSKAVALAASIPPQGGQLLPTNFAANSGYDNAQIAKIRSFNFKCEADAKEANKFLPSTNGGLTASNICSKNNKALVNDLLPDANIEQLCAQNNSSDNNCNEEKYFEQLNKKLAGDISLCRGAVNPNKVFVSKDDNLNPKCKDKEDSKSAKYPISSSEDFKKYSSAISKKLEICNLAKEGSKSDLQLLASAYNCMKAKKTAGEVSVSFCNNSVTGEVNQKDSKFENLAGVAGAAVGTFKN